MKITQELTDESVLLELGRRIARTRLERNLTQRQLAEEAGVERKALQRVEAGESVRLVSLVRVLRALGLLEALDSLVPEPAPSPIELLALQGRRRRRASGGRGRERRPEDRSPGWQWGDERPGTGR